MGEWKEDCEHRLRAERQLKCLKIRILVPEERAQKNNEAYWLSYEQQSADVADS